LSTDSASFHCRPFPSFLSFQHHDWLDDRDIFFRGITTSNRITDQPNSVGVAMCNNCCTAVGQPQSVLWLCNSCCTAASGPSAAILSNKVPEQSRSEVTALVRSCFSGMFSFCVMIDLAFQCIFTFCFARRGFLLSGSASTVLLPDPS